MATLTKSRDKFETNGVSWGVKSHVQAVREETMDRIRSLSENDEDCCYSDEAIEAVIDLMAYIKKQFGPEIASGLVSGEPGCPCVVIHNVQLARRVDIDIAVDGLQYTWTYQDSNGIAEARSESADPEQLAFLFIRLRNGVTEADLAAA